MHILHLISFIKFFIFISCYLILFAEDNKWLPKLQAIPSQHDIEIFRLKCFFWDFVLARSVEKDFLRPTISCTRRLRHIRNLGVHFPICLNIFRFVVVLERKITEIYSMTRFHWPRPARRGGLTISCTGGCNTKRFHWPRPARRAEVAL